MRSIMIKGLALTVIALMIGLTSGPASAQDIPSGSIGDGVAVYAQVRATGYTGWGPWRSRITTNRSEYGFSSVGVGDDDVQLLAQSLCAADFAVESQAFTTERRANGWVRASAIFWTWDDCPLSGRHGAWAQKYVWVPPGGQATLNFTLRNGAGGMTARVTFVNYWTPKIDTSELRFSAPVPSGFGF